MPIKLIFAALLIAVLAAAGWRHLDTDTLRALTGQTPPKAVIRFDNDPPPGAGNVEGRAIGRLSAWALARMIRR